MVVRIKSLLTTGPLIVPLSSGGTVRLSPGQFSDDLHEVEVTGNAKLEKLLRQRVVDVVTVGAATRETVTEEAPKAAAEGASKTAAEEHDEADSRARSRKRAAPAE